MIVFIALPLAAIATYALGGLDYLRRLLLPPAPSTNPVAPPYNPPFLGGQCEINYRIPYSIRGADGSVRNRITGVYSGKITNIEPVDYTSQGQRFRGFRVYYSNGALNSLIVSSFNDGDEIPVLGALQPQDGSVDNCGDLPNPNPTQPIPDGGIPFSQAPNLDNSVVVKQGSPIVVIPDFLTALAAALAAAKAAADALAGIKSIADAIASLADLLKKLKDKLDKGDKEDRTKTVLRYDFGSVSKDGFLRLYPQDNTKEIEFSYLDLVIDPPPPKLGKYLGSLSPNYYRYADLGYIAFVSPTFGVIEVQKIEFCRVSLNAPPNAYGFYYHLGLDASVKANATGFYVKYEEAAK